MLKSKIKGFLRRIHKKDNEFTERYLSQTPFFAGFWARRGLSLSIKSAASYVRGMVLDAGCGNKPYRRYFTKQVTRYIGIDYSSASGYLGNKADIYADIRKLPFSDDFFDTILCLEVLEHVDQPDLLIEEFGRVIRQNGKILISSPFVFPVHSDGVDYFRFTARGLKEVIKRNGFRILEVVPICGSARTLSVLLNTYIYYGCFFWNKFLYPVSIILRPVLWISILFINILAGLLDKVFKVDFLPFGHMVIAERL